MEEEVPKAYLSERPSERQARRVQDLVKTGASVSSLSILNKFNDAVRGVPMLRVELKEGESYDDHPIVLFYRFMEKILRKTPSQLAFDPSQIFASVATIVQYMYDGTTSLMSHVKQVLYQTAETTIAWIKSFFEFLRQGLNDIFTSAKETVGNVYERARHFVQDAYDWLKTWLGVRAEGGDEEEVRGGGSDTTRFTLRDPPKGVRQLAGGISYPTEGSISRHKYREKVELERTHRDFMITGGGHALHEKLFETEPRPLIANASKSFMRHVVFAGGEGGDDDEDFGAPRRGRPSSSSSSSSSSSAAAAATDDDRPGVFSSIMSYFSPRAGTRPVPSTKRDGEKFVFGKKKGELVGKADESVVDSSIRSMEQGISSGLSKTVEYSRTLYESITRDKDINPSDAAYREAEEARKYESVQKAVEETDAHKELTARKERLESEVERLTLSLETARVNVKKLIDDYSDELYRRGFERIGIESLDTIENFPVPAPDSATPRVEDVIPMREEEAEEKRPKPSRKRGRKVGGGMNDEELGTLFETIASAQDATRDIGERLKSRQTELDEVVMMLIKEQEKNGNPALAAIRSKAYSALNAIVSKIWAFTKWMASAIFAVMKFTVMNPLMSNLICQGLMRFVDEMCFKATDFMSSTLGMNFCQPVREGEVEKGKGILNSVYATFWNWTSKASQALGLTLSAIMNVDLFSTFFEKFSSSFMFGLASPIAKIFGSVADSVVHILKGTGVVLVSYAAFKFFARVSAYALSAEVNRRDIMQSLELQWTMVKMIMSGCNYRAPADLINRTSLIGDLLFANSLEDVPFAKRAACSDCKGITKSSSEMDKKKCELAQLRVQLDVLEDKRDEILEEGKAFSAYDPTLRTNPTYIAWLEKKEKSMANHKVVIDRFKLLLEEVKGNVNLEMDKQRSADYSSSSSMWGFLNVFSPTAARPAPPTESSSATSVIASAAAPTPTPTPTPTPSTSVVTTSTGLVSL